MLSFKSYIYLWSLQAAELGRSEHFHMPRMQVYTWKRRPHGCHLWWCDDRLQEGLPSTCCNGASTWPHPHTGIQTFWTVRLAFDNNSYSLTIWISLAWIVRIPNVFKNNNISPCLNKQVNPFLKKKIYRWLYWNELTCYFLIRLAIWTMSVIRLHSLIRAGFVLLYNY